MTRHLCPDDPDGVLYDAVMGGAWLAFIRWAYGLPEAREAFTSETGIAWPSAPTSAIDTLIDQATGAQDHVYSSSRGGSRSNGGAIWKTRPRRSRSRAVSGRCRRGPGRWRTRRGSGTRRGRWERSRRDGGGGGRRGER
jgi:hypothetical protein